MEINISFTVYGFRDKQVLIKSESVVDQDFKDYFGSGLRHSLHIYIFFPKIVNYVSEIECGEKVRDHHDTSLSQYFKFS